MARRRARTCEAPSEHLDLLVLEYSCTEHQNLKLLGSRSKEMKWRVAALGTPAMTIRVTVDKVPTQDPWIAIFEDKVVDNKQISTKLFPLGDLNSARLKQDFEFKWPYRGQPQFIAGGVGQEFGIERWEVKPKGSSEWYTALGLVFRRDGFFEASVWLPDELVGWKLVSLPAIGKESIRDVKTKKPLEIPVREVVLTVPKDNPIGHTTLVLIDGGSEEEFTHFFSRVTPPPLKGSLESQSKMKELAMVVDKERKQVTTNETHSVLENYMKNVVGAQGYKADRHKFEWKIMIGAAAEHTILVERKTIHKTLTLTVDGTVLVEAKARHLNMDEVDDEDDEPEDTAASTVHPWVCKFYFVGDRSVKFLIFEESKEGMILDTTDKVEGLSKDQQHWKTACTVTVPNYRDLRDAELMIDEKRFGDLKEPRKKSDGEDQVLHPDVLKIQYDITVPHKIRHEAPPLMKQAQHDGIKALGGLLNSVGATNLANSVQAGNHIPTGGAKGSGKGGYNA